MNGICNCGTVTFELSGVIPSAYQCHCTLCQKQGGAGANLATIVTSDKFRWISGQDKIQKWQKNTGFSSHFCKHCGSPAPNTFQSKYVWIPMGLMENSTSNIVANLWLSSKPDWANVEKQKRNYNCAPENIDEFVQFLTSPRST